HSADSIQTLASFLGVDVSRTLLEQIAEAVTFKKQEEEECKRADPCSNSSRFYRKDFYKWFDHPANNYAKPRANDREWQVKMRRQSEAGFHLSKRDSVRPMERHDATDARRRRGNSLREGDEYETERR
ncbi:hypothetical protein BaRGS_00036434, partial [Batillaria attramentaria]